MKLSSSKEELEKSLTHIKELEILNDKYEGETQKLEDNLRQLEANVIWIIKNLGQSRFGASWN